MRSVFLDNRAAGPQVQGDSGTGSEWEEVQGDIGTTRGGAGEQGPEVSERRWRGHREHKRRCGGHRDQK